jgi:hypothetical protein
MESITGDDLLSLANEPLPVDSVVVGAPLNKRVWAQGLTALERSKWERSLLKKNAEKVDGRRVERARGTLLARCLIKGKVNGEGSAPLDRTRLYNADDESTVERLMKLPASVVEPIYDLCRALSGIGDKELDDLGKLSDETPSSDSASS